MEKPHISQRVLTRVMVIEDNQLLLVKNSKSDFWYPPGGGWEPGESLEECAIREVYEETGYKIRVDDLVWVREFLDKNQNIVNLETFWKAHLANDNEQTPNGLEQHIDHDTDSVVEDARWFGAETLRSMKIFPQKLQNISSLDEIIPVSKVYIGNK